MILRSQIELSANPLVLGGRSLEQGAVGLLEEPARVHPGFIEKELEEIVSQVIMGGDIFATSKKTILSMTEPCIDSSQSGPPLFSQRK